MENKKLKIKILDVLIDKHIGKVRTEKRDIFGHKLQLNIIRETIKNVRKQRNLAQEQFGGLIGVKKAQISKIENSLIDARFETILKVFKALNAKLNFNVELMNQSLVIN